MLEHIACLLIDKLFDCSTHNINIKQSSQIYLHRFGFRLGSFLSNIDKCMYMTMLDFERMWHAGRLNDNRYIAITSRNMRKNKEIKTNNII